MERIFYMSFSRRTVKCYGNSVHQEEFELIKLKNLGRIESKIRTVRPALFLFIGIRSDDAVFRDIEILREKTQIPIIVVLQEEKENGAEINRKRIELLEMGIDDVVKESINPNVLKSIIISQIRRYRMNMEGGNNKSRLYRCGNLVLDDEKLEVRIDEEKIALTPIEYSILKLLISGKGKVLSVNQIYESIWKMEPLGADNIIPVHIRHIREKIEKDPRDPQYLKVVWGSGYKVG